MNSTAEPKPPPFPAPPGPEPENPKLTAILDAARVEFVKRGFAEARLDRIAQTAGVGKGTIYLYFESKAELFEAVVRGAVLPELDTVEALIEHYDGPTDELIRLMLRTIGAKLVDGPVRDIVRLILAEGKNFPDIPAFYHREVVSRGMGIVKRLLARGIERGEFRDGAYKDFPQLVMAPVLTAAVWKMLFDAQAPLDTMALIEAHIDVLMKGIRGRHEGADK